MTPPVRPTARVLLLDDADRLLLFRGFGDDGSTFWFPPGGALEPGETAEQAAVREVREETGASVELGPEVWTRRHVVSWNGVAHDVRERWFVARVAAFEVDVGGFTADERRWITAHAWWTAAELAATRERLVPADLADRLATLLRDGPPAAPFEVGI